MPITSQYILIIVGSILMVFLIIIFIKLIKREKEFEKEDYLISQGETIENKSFKRLIDRKIKINRGHNYFTVLGIAISNYQEIIDSYGEIDTLKVINGLKQNLKSNLPSLSVLGNSDENNTFYIYLPKILTDREINALLISLKKRIDVRVRVFGDLYIQIESVFSYVTYPLSGSKALDLLTNLKLSLYLGERGGGNLITAYSKHMDKSKEFIDLYYEVKKAMSNKEFVLYYQPIINTKLNVIDGFETFIRWDHPKQGVLSPDKFISVLENSGDINWIGLWSVEEIFKTHLELFNKNKLTANYHVNFSHIQLLNPDLIGSLQRLMDKYRISPELLTIEIVDFEKLLNHEQALRMLLQLINNNIKVAVSINEINYQLLTDIEKHRINVVKLNNKIVRGSEVTTENFLITIKELVNKKNLKVIVESVEEENEKNQAIKEGFNIQQGFYYSKPVNQESIYDLVLKL